MRNQKNFRDLIRNVTWWLQNGQCHQISSSNSHGSIVFGSFDNFIEVTNIAFGIGILKDNSGNVFLGEISFKDILYINLDFKWFSSGLHTTYGLGM